MINLAPLVDQVVLPILTAVLVAAVTWAINRIAAYAKFQVNEGQRKMVETAIANGIAFARRKVDADGAIEVKVPDLVADVVDYVMPKIPGALKGLGVTPDHLAALVEARLAQLDKPR